MKHKRNSVTPASPQDSLTVLREVSEAYERLKVARKAAAVRAQRDKATYVQIGEAAGVTPGHAHVLVNGRGPERAA